MGEANRIIVLFEEVGKEDLSLVGGKGANLGELLRHGIPVPPGFVVTAPAYSSFLEKAHLKAPIQELLEKLDTSDTKALQETSARIKELITEAPMPSEITEAIEHAYT
ncbi:MAG TPA: PEP/pyruvate-binding domain-containing protein, partial [Dehalococcoidia bacterium]|nr:PEP/pyruvate-binding domain-containing protein [Dehalococcoidia bacterium]